MNAPITPPLLVLAVGNPSRGDDAFGPLLAQQLTDWLAQQAPAWRQRVEVIPDQQLVVEHAYDLQGRQRVLFVDASVPGPQGVSLSPLPPPALQISTHQAPAWAHINSHRSSPQEILALYAGLLDHTPPQADLLTLPGHGFEFQLLKKLF